MAEYTNPTEEIIENLPEGINVDGIGDIPEGGDDVKVPLMKNGEPYPPHIVAEDLGHDPDYSDTGTDDDDDPYEDWDWDYDDDDDDDPYEDWDWDYDDDDDD